MARFQELDMRMEVWSARSFAKKNQLLMEEWLTGQTPDCTVELMFGVRLRPVCYSSESDCAV